MKSSPGLTSRQLRTVISSIEDHRQTYPGSRELLQISEKLKRMLESQLRRDAATREQRRLEARLARARAAKKKAHGASIFKDIR